MVPVICLVGSSRFKAKFHEIGEKLEKSGRLPLMMSFFQHADRRPVSQAERELMFRVDCKRIDLSSEVWVINDLRHWCEKCRIWVDHGYYDWPKPGMGSWHCHHCRKALEQKPYIGEDTLREVSYAANESKVLRWLNPPEPGSLSFNL
jgi:hypothetical protein